MTKISKLVIVCFLFFTGALIGCEGEEEQFGWSPGENLIIQGAGTASTLTEEEFFVEGFTVNEDYTWTVNGETVTPIDEGEAISVFFDEPGDYTITVSNGTYTGTHVVTVSSVAQEVAFGDTVFTATEGDTLLIPVAISERNPTTNTTVSFSVTGGVEGEDYEVLTPSPLEFFETNEDGELIATTADTIRIRILNNLMLQDNRTINVNLNAVETTGEGEYEVTLGENAQEVEATIGDQLKYVSIVDAADTIVLTSANAAGVYTIPVELSVASEEPVTVTYEVVDNIDDELVGDPTEGVSDLTGGSLTFAPGTTNQPISLRLSEEAFESNREIHIRITNVESDDEQVMVETVEDEDVNALKVISVEVEEEEEAGAGE